MPDILNAPEAVARNGQPAPAPTPPRLSRDGQPILGPEVWDKPHPACAEMRIVDAAEGLVECVPRRKKVIICGFAGSSLNAAPFDDPSYELWGLNQLQPHLPRRVDRQFEIHLPQIFTRDISRDTNYVAWLSACPVPVYMAERYPAVAQAVKLPLERILTHFELWKPGAPLAQGFITSTPAWMVALAIVEGFETIALYGIDLVVGPEYIEQKHCMAFYLGWAMAKGIEIELPRSCALLKSRFLYGFEDPIALEGPVNKIVIDKRLETLRAKREELLTGLNNLDGAIAEHAVLSERLTLWERGVF